MFVLAGLLPVVAPAANAAARSILGIGVGGEGAAGGRGEGACTRGRGRGEERGAGGKQFAQRADLYVPVQRVSVEGGHGRGRHQARTHLPCVADRTANAHPVASPSVAAPPRPSR